MYSAAKIIDTALSWLSQMAGALLLWLLCQYVAHVCDVLCGSRRIPTQDKKNDCLCFYAMYNTTISIQFIIEICRVLWNVPLFLNWLSDILSQQCGYVCTFARWVFANLHLLPTEYNAFIRSIRYRHSLFPLYAVLFDKSQISVSTRPFITILPVKNATSANFHGEQVNLMLIWCHPFVYTYDQFMCRRFN